ncbi:TPA: hypothetical protein MM072_005500 [Klebsiella pneumoniae]|nr:hypothetical protein [Klebsiella pneumoniae]HDS9330665.1 hypothetical protein [Klebsiella pneumoniae subsp. pneumoniae]HBR1478462.1 hypothetical protein [Klebsiella pneumoniae]HBR1526548.1 hypothetical protein [Klebsiella pneumoniae]HBR1760536.1 hypothetical protein [Klebsiella pneumoniae]
MPERLCCSFSRDLLPGSAVLQHSAALLHHFFSHYPAASAYSPWHVRSTEEILAAF